MDMIITTTGGYVGLRRSLDIDTDTLPPDTAAEIRRLVLLCLEHATVRDARARDAVDVSITADGRRVSFQEHAAPEEWLTLRTTLAAAGLQLRYGSSGR